MEKNYQYRKHLKKPMQLLISISLIVLITIVYIQTLVIFKSGNDILFSFIFISIQILMLVLILGIESLILNFIFFNKFKYISIALNDEGIIYSNNKFEEKIPYKDIKEIKFSSIKYAGGWIKIIHSNGNIRLTVVLENIADFTKNLKEQLDKTNRGNIYNQRKMNNFYKTAVSSDQGWERGAAKRKFILISTSLNMIIAYFIALSVSNIDFRFIIALMGELSVYSSFLISEIIIRFKLFKNIKGENIEVLSRDMKREEVIYKTTFLIIMSVQVLIDIILLAL